MEDLNQSNIENFRAILKVLPKDGTDKINFNFEKLSVVVHPSIRKEQKYIDYFEQLVLAHEFLIYMQNNKKTQNTEQILNNWNKSEKERVVSIIDKYKSMSLSAYKKETEPDIAIFETFKTIIFAGLGISSIIGIIYIAYMFITKSMSTPEYIVYIISIILLCIFAYAGLKKRNFWLKKK